MKIYFSGSIRGGRDDKETYLLLIQYLKKYGKVLTEHIGDSNLTDSGEANISEKSIYARDMAWLQESDVVIAEVSNPSIGVGYEIAKAESMNKKILCLYSENRDKKLSVMISGNLETPVLNYQTLEDAFRQIDIFFKSIG